ncbi:MAG: response regulator [Desulfobacteraceae bacterium]
MPGQNSTDIFPHKVLVIDDQRSHLKLMRNRLSKYGCQVITSDSAEEAMQMIQWGDHFPLIITDLKMPWLDGAQFCKRVKASNPEFRVVALTGHIGTFDREELEGSGFDGIYEKPVTDALVRQILASARP